MKTKKILSRKTINITYIFLGIALCVYGLLFFSKIILPNPISSEDITTKVGKEYEFSDKRSYVLISALYSEEEKEVEVVLSFKNNSFDGINNYHTICNVAGKEKLQTVEEVFNEPLLTVLRIKNVKNLDELNLYIAPKFGELKDVQDEDTTMIILNKHNIIEVPKIEEKTKAEYMEDRLKVIITDHIKKEKTEYKKLEELEEKVDNLQKENQELEASKGYLTPEEIVKISTQISENIREIEDIKNEILLQKKVIEEIKSQKKDAEEKLKALKKIVENS